MRWAFAHSRLTLLVIAWAVSSSAALLVQHGGHAPLCRRSSVIAWRTRSHPVAIDASLAADAVITSASQLPTYVVPEDPHTLANLGPDLLNTAMVSLLGLVGAYVTQGTEGLQDPSPDEDFFSSEEREPRREPRGQLPSPLDEDYY